MRKYAFRIGDLVREKTADTKPVIGRVISCGSSAEHDFYKIESHGDTWGARDDELELMRRGHARELGRFLLVWHPMTEDPPKDAECIVIWTRHETGKREFDLMRWNGEGWVMVLKRFSGLTEEFVIHRDVIDAWSLWEWPETN